MSNSIVDRPTGSMVQEQFGRMKARLVARYRLVAVPGRPEELVSTRTPGMPRRGVSLGYGCRTIRVRLMLGREWVHAEDFQIREGWGIPLAELCDEHFGHIAPDKLIGKLLPNATDVA